MIVELTKQEFKFLKKVLDESKTNDRFNKIASLYDEETDEELPNETIINMIMDYMKEVKHQSDKFINFWNNAIAGIEQFNGVGGLGYMTFKKIPKTDDEIAEEKTEHGYNYDNYWIIPDYEIDGETWAEIGEQFYNHVSRLKRNKRIADKIVNINEANEPDYMNGQLSQWDKRRLDQGRAPTWAKKVTDIGPRKKELRQSSSHSEVAMRSVNTDNGRIKTPYTEDDWRRAKESNKLMNVEIAEQLKTKLSNDYKISADEREVSVLTNNYVFRVSSRGPRYYVLRFNPGSVFDRKSQMCKSLAEVVSFIEEND